MFKARLVLVWSSLVLQGLSAVAQNFSKSPNVSANALFLYRNSNFSKEDASTVRNGIDVQEAEIAYFSDVDPYSRLNLLFSVHPEYTLDTTKTPNTLNQEWKLEPEEAYAETDSVPSTTFRVGKFKAAFGKHNLLHSHARPFVDAPVASATLLGDEGLNDVGLSASVLLPLSWFSELSGQYLRGEGENTGFNSPTPGDGVGVGHWKNLWDLSEALTMELGASYASGGNSLGGNTSLVGADLSFKWRPSSEGKYHSWILAGEYIDRRLEQPTSSTENGMGWNVWGQYQFAERWSVLGRYDHLKVEGADSAVNSNALENIITDKYSAALVFTATEFSSYRVEYSHAVGPSAVHGENNERKLYLQGNFTIGAHPVHSY